MTKGVAAILDRSEQFYDANVAGKLAGFVEGNDRVELAWQTLETWAPPNPARVLEVGCAIGDICWRMSRRWPDAEIVGVDISRKSIELAAQLFGGPSIRFVPGQLTTAAVTGPFDLVVMLDVYEHVPKPARAELHDALRRLLGDRGIVFLSFPTPEHLAWLREHRPEEIQPVDEDVDLPTIATLATDSKTDVALYKKVNVWHLGDYGHAVLRRETWKPHGKPQKPAGKSQESVGFAQRLQRYWSPRPNLTGTRAERLRRVRHRLGPDSYSRS